MSFQNMQRAIAIVVTLIAINILAIVFEAGMDFQKYNVNISVCKKGE